METQNGYIRILSINRVPLFIHWSVLLIAFVIQLPFIDRGFYEGPVFALSYIFIVFFHEIGHWFFARLFGCKVYGLEVIGAGGYCHCEPSGSNYKDFLIISGGVIFQALLFFVAYIVAYLFKGFENKILKNIFLFFTFSNLIMILINLFPSKKSDGYELLNIVFAMLKNKENKP